MTRILTDEPAGQELVRLGLERSAEFSWERAARETAAVYAAVRATLAPREPADERDGAAVTDG
jgi:hypothetical protein